jgi:subtilase family serine protease
MTAVVDQTQQVRESNESNNRLEQTKFFNRVIDTGQIGPAVIGPVDGGTPADKPDLSVSEIQVKGKNPSGTSDCDPGENDVTVLVPDQGGATGFVVRLVVDDRQNQAREVTIPPSDTSRIVAVIRVPFGDVRLNQGDHTLTATADSGNAIDESNEGNNSKTITVTCRNE